MKKIIALGLAAAVTVGSMAAVTGTASAEPNWQKKSWNKNWNGNKNWNNNKWSNNNNWKWRNRHNGGWVAPFVFGSVLGYGLGSYYNNGPYYGSGYYNDAHVQWCLDHYRTYNPRTNTYFIRRGVAVACNSPYG